MSKTCEKCIHYDVCRYPLECRAFPETCWKYEEPRPHGEWIPFEWDPCYKTKISLPKGSDSHMEEYWAEEFMCSVCGKAHHARDFCPNCGADMREEGEEQ